MEGLHGKVAIITGGAQSLGAEVVRSFHKAGTKVAIADIAEAPGAALAEELGDGAIFQKTDIARDRDIQLLVERTAKTFGRVDFLVNIACTYLDDGMSSPREDWLTSYNVNVVGHVMLMQTALPHLKKRGGAIVNFSSISGRVAQTGRWLYPVTKAAIAQLTRNQALDLAPFKIRVNSVSPGWIWCRLMSEVSNDDKAKTSRVAAPFHMLGRVGEGREVAETVMFLCSDHASFITGTDVAVDGGYGAMGPEQGVPAISKLME